MRIWLIAALGVTLLSWGCVERKSGQTAATGPGAVCSDRDGDGYGQGCDGGHDCDDRDPQVHEGCLRCATPERGCACADGSAPVSCYLEKTIADDGTEMCHEGTRYCRDGTWSSCESVHSYPKPDRGELTAIIDSTGAPVTCSDCNIKCYVIRDNLDPVDGGLSDAGNGVSWASGGGLQLGTTTTVWEQPTTGTIDGGTVTGPTGCMPGTAPDVDCDGIPDKYDAYPFQRPFATTNPAIFLDLAPGETGSGTIELVFFMNTLDIYFLLDQTDSMNAVRRKLQSALLNGTFLGADVECADTDLDGLPNDELKTQGVLGGIRCLLREAEVGAGYFREIPFSTYGNDDEIAFRHVLDMTTDHQTAIDGINEFDIDRDVDWPDAHPLALYALATGEGLYMGLDKPGVPPKVGCASERWGYACFRPDAIPVVLMFTDSPMHQGPPAVDRDFNYDPSRLTVTTGSQASYTSVPSDNEDFTTQTELGEISASYVTYAGDTSTMTSDVTRATMTCLASGRDAAPDATFSFALNTAQKVAFTTSGSGFSPAVAVYNHLVDQPAAYSSTNTNETSVQSMNLGEVADGWSLATGSTSSMAADYKGSFIGCGADDAAPDAVFAFSLAQDREVTIETVGSTFDGVISLHQTAPALSTYVAATNSNEDTGTSATVLGDAYQRIYEVTGGNTAGMIADYTGAQIGCNADNAAPDAVYRFDLTQPTRVRIDASGSFDTVLGLADGALGSKLPLVVSGGDKQETPIELGDMVHGWYGLSGTTAGLTPNYRSAFIGCNSDTFSPDGVVHFSLSQATRVRLNTTGSAFDTVLSLHNGDIDPTTPLTTDNRNETASAPMVLGTVDDAWFEIFGGNTTTMSADYDGNVVGCGADSFSRDAVFAFNVLTDTRVRIDTLGSTFDTVVSLFDAPPPINSHTDVKATDAEPVDVGTVNDGSRVFRGTTAGLAADYGGAGMGCNTEETPADVAFKFHVDRATEVEINTEDSAFDTSIGLFPDVIRDPLKPSAFATDNTNEDKASAKDAGALDGAWQVFSGTTTGMGADMTGYCGAPNSSRDAVFSFKLNAATTIRLNTTGSALDTVVGLYNSTTDALIACNDNGAGGTAALVIQPLAAGTYHVVVKGARTSDKGAYVLSMRDVGLSNPIACNDDAFVSGRSRIVANLLPGDYHLVLKGARAGHEGAFAVRFRDNDWWAQTHRLACNDDVNSSYVSQLERDLTAGTYYIVLKGDLAVDQGPFMLTVRSVSSAATTSHTLSCNDDLGASTTASQLEADLPAGEYWAVVKGKSSGGAPYALEVRDIGPSGQGLVVACDDDSGGGTAARIERDLAAGSYYLFVKGDAASDKGTYQLSVRDLTNTGGTALTCDDDSAGSGAARIQRNLTKGNYWVVLKGDAAGDAGPYTLSVRDHSSATRRQYGCTTSSSGTFDLAAGRYDLVLKGSDNDQSGAYALTLGNGVTHQTTFTPPSWNQTLNALQDRDMRVITVLNCHDNGLHGDGRDCDYAHQQAEDVADATDALGPNLEKLVIDIDANGDGIESAIMTQLQLLSGHLEMDVSARVVFEPDLNPGFIVKVEAIDRPGDGCSGLVGIEHQNCRPGATPRFVISITNPLDAPVPLNPNDPSGNGGYNFRADLIADGKYFVDAVPIYVIPEDVNESQPEPIYALESMGEYWQDVPSAGCSGNERPDWQDLIWTADVPTGTSITFNACTGENAAALETCTYSQIATVSGVGTCTSDAQCPVGFCSAGACQVIHGAACSSDMGCSTGSVCDLAVGRCRYSGQPVKVDKVLGGGNLFTNLRMNIVLKANTMTNAGPTVHDWAVTYLCRNVN